VRLRQRVTKGTAWMVPYNGILAAIVCTSVAAWFFEDGFTGPH
jgi:hypothetical protein